MRMLFNTWLDSRKPLAMPDVAQVGLQGLVFFHARKGNRMAVSNYIRTLRQHVGNELLILPSVTAIIFDEGNRVLLAKHADTKRWVALGGSIEPNEKPLDAVIREVMEETGLIVVPTKILGVFGGPEFEVVYSNGDRVTYVMTVYECKIIGGELKPDHSETVELRYVEASDFARLDLASWASVGLAEVCGNREHLTSPR